MRALVLPACEVTDQPSPALADGEALVHVSTAGVCDTDLQLARGYMGFSGIPGHELIGQVVACADASWLGVRVVADINAGCGTCVECTTRGGHHCPNRTVLGILGRGGAFAQTIAIPIRCLVKVPLGVSDDAAVFAEPLAAALHVLDEVAKPNRAIVLGDGKLGLLIALALVGAGVETHVVGRHAHKLKLAAGAKTYLEGDDCPAGADLVVEATGSESGLARALALIAPRGTVVLKTTVAAKLNVDLAPVVIHEIRVIGSRCGDLQRAVAMLAAKTVDPLPLVEARYPLDRAAEAFAHAGRKGPVKILVDMPPA